KQTSWANGFMSEYHSRKPYFPRKNAILCREFSRVQDWIQRHRRQVRRSKHYCVVTAGAHLERRHCACSLAKKESNKKINALCFRPSPVSYAVGMARSPPQTLQ